MRKGKLPVYLQIAGQFREKIVSGYLNPGDMLPSESSLCSEYGISRDTARKSLQELEKEGLVFVRPKIGYFVCSPKHADVALRFPEAIPGCTTSYLDINGRVPDREVQEALGLSENSKVLEFTQLIRSAKGTPVGIDVKYMPYRRSYPSVESEMRFAVFPDITMPHVTPYAYYTEFTISAASAVGKQAELLQCVEKTPLLLIRRLMIERSGKRIAYALRYLLPEYGCLFGSSGYVNEDGGFPKSEPES